MIDIHSHILHNVDDGPETLDEAIAIVRLAYLQGITHMIATPHFKVPEYQNKRAEQSYQELKEALKAASIDMALSLGNEIYLNEEAITAIENKTAYSLADSNYLLIELPWCGMFGAYEQMLYIIQQKGFRIILAHVERYGFLMNDIRLLNEFVSLGCYAQINSSALLHSKASKKAYKLIEEGLIHIVATDCHDTKNRAPELFEAYKKVAQSFGKELADNLFQNNAQSVLNNEEIIKRKAKMGC